MGQVSEVTTASGVAADREERRPSRWLGPLVRLPCPVVQPPASGNSWLGVGAGELPVGAIYEWCLQPQCGAVVLFSGTVRDHAIDEEGILREGVQHLTYEVYEAQVVPTFGSIEAELRVRWPHTGRVAMVHRSGRLGLMESSVVVAVSAPHRHEAFDAASYAIDAIKAAAPIWKHEMWAGGTDWGTGAHVPVAPSAVPAAARAEQT